MKTIATSLLVLIVSTASQGEGDAGSVSDPLSSLRREHPRLIVLEDDVERVQELIGSGGAARGLYEAIRKEAEKTLTAPPVVHELIGPRLLGQSRRCLSRVYTLAAVYRLEGDRRFAKRAEQEMLAAAAFPDWNPSHFLDTAEMTHALAIGYDWLHDTLSEDGKQAIRKALVEKGLKPGLDAYRKGLWWTRCQHNWNQVCNGGLTIGALAVADEEPQLATDIITRATERIRIPTARLEPDGGWDEGPGYWNYALRYTAYYLAAVRSALGTDFGLVDMSGLAQTGLFRIYSIGPLNRTFNYADAGDSPGNAAQMFLFARLFDRPVYATHQRRFRTGADPLDLFWWDSRGSDAVLLELPLCRRFQNVETVFLRSAWNDRDAWFVGFKGGDNGANHSHLDLGTFVLDGMGKRWALDLGPDDYNMPGYFGSKRWTYYRLRTEGHNTLVLNGENQEAKAKAPIVAFGHDVEWGFAVADLSAAYAKHARSVHRGLALRPGKCLLVQDEIAGAAQAEWAMHTSAQIEVDGDMATLQLGDKRLRAQIMSPADGRWRVSPVKLEPPQRPLGAIQRLSTTVTTTEPMTRIVVVLAPADEPAGEALSLPLMPLADWAR